MRRRPFPTWVPVVALAGGGLALALLARREVRGLAGPAAWPVSMAHRGASGAAPENTLAAFGLAVEEGAGGLELDAHMTRDGEVVVIHDAAVDRTTDGTGLVREMSLAELRRLDAGYRFTPDGGRSHPFRGRGVTVPTLREVYAAFPATPINVEIKEDQAGVEGEVLRVIREAGAEERTIVAAGRHPVIRRFRGLGSGIPTAASHREVEVFFVLSRLWLEGLLRPRYAALQVPPAHRGVRVVTRRLLAAARRLGVRVDVWTIDEPGEMRRLLDLGADAIMTNRPAVLEGVLRGGR